jgi:hypothetical protein
MRHDRLVFRIRQERQVARLRVLDTGHADDVDVAVAVEPASELRSEIP